MIGLNAIQKGAAEAYNRQVELLENGVPYDPDVMERNDLWDALSEAEKSNYVETALQPPPEKVPVDFIPDFDKIEEALKNKINKILEKDYLAKKEAFDKLETKEGVEAPKKETYKTIEKEFDDIDTSIREKIESLANCLTKG
jgi:hypothetical protein